MWESFEKDVCAREGDREIVCAGQNVPSVKSVCLCVCVSFFSKACSVGMQTAVASSHV